MPKKSGFTFIELLVVIGIMAIIGVMTIANFGNIGESKKLAGAGSDIQTLLKSAQTNATSRVSCPLGTTNFGASWWVEVKASVNTVILKCQIGSGTIATVKTHDITSQSSSLLVDSVTCSNGTATPNTITASFAPLYGTTTFADSGGISCIPTSQYITINLKNSKIPNEVKSVKIDKGGSISVQ